MNSGRIPLLTCLLVLAVVGQSLAVRACAAETPADSAGPEDRFRFKVDVNLVRVSATVTDLAGYVVKGLKKEDFELLEDATAQEIVEFDPEENAPLSLAILLDVSGSMIDKIDEAADALRHFLSAINPASEACVFCFSGRAWLVQDFTADRRQLSAVLEGGEVGGGTAMYDAVSGAVAKLREGKFSKKAILLITDGNDTASGKDYDAVRRELQSSDVSLYAIGIGHSERGSFGHGTKWGGGDEVNEKVLKGFTEDTGGHTVIVKGAHKVKGVDVVDAAALDVARDLNYQYTLAYVSGQGTRAGWRGIKVIVKKKDLRVLARRGYRVPEAAPQKPQR